jgi:long-chain acyl-CoA synthetase
MTKKLVGPAHQQMSALPAIQNIVPRIEEPILGAAFAGFSRLLLRSGWPLDIRGAEWLPVNQTSIVCSNHNSHLDGIALIAATAAAGNPHTLLAARDYFFDRPVRRALVSAILPIQPIDRNGSARALEELCRRLDGILASGPRTIIMFPEGGRSRTGRIGAFKGGIGRLAASLGVPVVPAFVEGSRRCMPPGRWLPRPGPLRVTFAQPLWPEEHADLSGRRGGSRALTREVEVRIRRLASVTDA